VDLDDDGNISPSTEPGHGLRWAEDARDRYFVEG
jgi:hypothetical protein